MTVSTATRLARTLRISTDEVEVDGISYVITHGTGDGTYAYPESDVEAWLDEIAAGRPTYQDFCDDGPAYEDAPAFAAAVYLESKGRHALDQGGCGILSREECAALKAALPYEHLWPLARQAVAGASFAHRPQKEGAAQALEVLEDAIREASGETTDELAEEDV